jgi:hypothetical protein
VVDDRLLAVRTRERRGPAWIGAELGVPARTVSRALVPRVSPGSAPWTRSPRR